MAVRKGLLQQFPQRLNQWDRGKRSQSCAPVTEMNFGLRFAENGVARVTRQTWRTVNVMEIEQMCRMIDILGARASPPA